MTKCRIEREPTRVSHGSTQVYTRVPSTLIIEHTFHTAVLGSNKLYKISHEGGRGRGKGGQGVGWGEGDSEKRPQTLLLLLFLFISSFLDGLNK